MSKFNMAAAAFVNQNWSVEATVGRRYGRIRVRGKGKRYGACIRCENYWDKG